MAAGSSTENTMEVGFPFPGCFLTSNILSAECGVSERERDTNGRCFEVKNDVKGVTVNRGEINKDHEPVSVFLSYAYHKQRCDV